MSLQERRGPEAQRGELPAETAHRQRGGGAMARAELQAKRHHGLPATNRNQERPGNSSPETSEAAWPC